MPVTATFTSTSWPIATIATPPCAKKSSARSTNFSRKSSQWGGVITGEHGIGLAKKRWWPQATERSFTRDALPLKRASIRTIFLIPANFWISAQGTPWPEFNFTCETSVALIVPLTLTSVRKLVAVTAFPDCNLVCETSVAFTVLFPVVSPSNTFMLTSVLGSICDKLSFMPTSEIVIFC